jgi:glycosyltransferase involved in cell wall biosynthesis
MLPIVSVIVPCFNLGPYLCEAVESVMFQTLQGVEIIIVNDGSTDPDTIRILEQWKAQGIVVLNTPNRGLSAARNEGIRAARGKYILPLDADDRIAPKYLECAMAVFEQDPAVGVVYGLVDLFGKVEGPWLQANFSVQTLLFENMIVASSVFRRSIWEQVGGYREEMVHGWEDWDFWLSIVEQGYKVIRLSEIVFYYRIRGGSLTEMMTLSQKIRMFHKLVMKHKWLYFKNWKAIIRRCLNPGKRLIVSPR